MSEVQKLWQYLAPYLTEHKKNLFEEVLANRTRHLVVVLEDLLQDRNMGAIARTCECMGIQDLYVIAANEHTQVAHSIAKGAEKWMDLHLFNQAENNSLACIAALKEQGYQIVATTPHAQGILPTDFKLEAKSALFFGGERYGLSAEVRAKADVFLRIPSWGFTESYNVSVSAALILYDLLPRLRARTDIPWQLNEEEALKIKTIWATRTIPNGAKIVEHFWQKLA